MSGKKVLLLYGHRQNIGGVVNFYKNLSKCYDKSDYEIVYFRVGAIKSIPIMNYKAVRLLDLIVGYVRFLIIIVFYKPLIVHINPSLDNKSIVRDFIFVYLAKKICRRVKILTHFRGWNETIIDGSQGGNLVNFSLNGLLRETDHFIVLANKFKKKLIKSCGKQEEVITVMTTTVDTSVYIQKPNKDKFKFNIIYLGRFVKDKGIYDIVDSVSRIVSENSHLNIVFTFAGDGDDLLSLKEYVQNLGVSEFVTFPGYLQGQEKVDLLLGGDIFLFPSYHGEGCPNAVLEAMAAGLPVISTSVGALGEIIEPSVNGLIVGKMAPNEIVASVNSLIRDDVGRVEIGLNNRKKAKEQFDTNAIFNKIENIYRSLAESY